MRTFRLSGLLACIHHPICLYFELFASHYGFPPPNFPTPPTPHPNAPHPDITLFLTIESVPIDLEPAALALYVDESPGDL
jgi:hypothetical protein